MLGTSMACPHVSGVVALLVSYFGGSGFTAEKCKKMLLDGANSDYKSSWHPVGPALDALGAFHAGDPSTEAPDKITDYTATPVRKTINFEVPVPADPDDVKPLSLVLYVGKDKAALQSMDLSSPPSSVITLELIVGETAVGASLKATVTGLEYDTKYYVAVASYDRSKNYSPLSDIKEVTTPVNHAPVKKADFADTILYDNGSTIKLTLLDYFQDPDGDPLTYSFTFEGMAAIATISGGAINVRAYNHGLTTFEITASDDDGKKCTSTLRVLVKSSSAPVETSPAQITDELVISTETLTSTHVKIVSSTGKVVFDRTESFSGFDPLVVDMASLAPGRYGLTVEYGGKKYSKVIVKI